MVSEIKGKSSVFTEGVTTISYLSWGCNFNRHINETYLDAGNPYPYSISGWDLVNTYLLGLLDFFEFRKPLAVLLMWIKSLNL